jgi:hypothetical protein
VFITSFPISDAADDDDESGDETSTKSHSLFLLSLVTAQLNILKGLRVCMWFAAFKASEDGFMPLRAPRQTLLDKFFPDMSVVSARDEAQSLMDSDLNRKAGADTSASALSSAAAPVSSSSSSSASSASKHSSASSFDSKSKAKAGAASTKPASTSASPSAAASSAAAATPPKKLSAMELLKQKWVLRAFFVCALLLG